MTQYIVTMAVLPLLDTLRTLNKLNDLAISLKSLIFYLVFKEYGLRNMHLKRYYYL